MKVKIQKNYKIYITYVLCLFGFIIVFTSTVLFADWSIPYGFKKGQLAYYNSKTSKIFEEATAYGPMAFRVVDGLLWVLDSIKARINVYNKENKLLNSIEIKKMPKDCLLEDFSLVFNAQNKVDYMWVGEAATSCVYKVKYPDGKILAKAGSHGNNKGQILQIYQIESNPKNGGVIVGDIARGMIIIYDTKGNFINEIPWQGYGFAIDNENNISVLEYSPKTGYVWKIYSLDNFAIQNVVYLGWHDYQNPRIYGVLPSGELLVSFVPPGGYRGTLKLVAFNKNGYYRLGTHLQPPKAMNRFFVLDSSEKNVSKSVSCWLAQADFDSAPMGFFQVTKFTFNLREDLNHE